MYKVNIINLILYFLPLDNYPSCAEHMGTVHQCGRHRRYLDGSPRPLFRGWLHGVSLACALLILPFSWSSMQLPEFPPVFSILITLALSSACHLYPWRSPVFETIVTRLDRVSIIGINMMSFVAPQLAIDPECRPSMLFTLLTAVIPNSICAPFVLAGYQHPLVWSGAIIASATTGVFFYTLDSTLFTLCCCTLIAYGVGMYIFILQPTWSGRTALRWGFHEWFHVIIVIGFGFNIATIHRLASICSDSR